MVIYKNLFVIIVKYKHEKSATAVGATVNCSAYGQSKHSHAVTAINIYLTSPQQAAYLVEVLCRNSYLRTECIPSYEQVNCFYGMLLSTAPAVLKQNINFFLSVIQVANVIRLFHATEKNR